MNAIRSKGYWQSTKNRRDFLLEFAKNKGISHPTEWGKVLTLDITRNGGRGLIASCGTLLKALQNSFPEEEWDASMFERKPANYWKDKSNQSRFLEKLAIEFDIKEKEDWGKLKSKDISKRGGSGLLNHNKSSIYKAIHSNFPEKKIGPLYFSQAPRRYWSSEKNQRDFLLAVAKKLNIEKPEDWYRVSNKEVIECGGSRLLQIYRNSLYKALSHLFPENDWKLSKLKRLPRLFWNEKKNHKQLFDELKINFKVKEPKDWGKVLFKRFISEVGYSPIKHYGSLLKALVSVYPDIEWERKWFVGLPLYAPSYWKSLSNQRKFLDSLAKEYNIVEPWEWQRITLGVIRTKGGRGLLKRYGDSLGDILSNVYGIDWKFSGTTRPQKTIQNIVGKQLF